MNLAAPQRFRANVLIAYLGATLGAAAEACLIAVSDSRHGLALAWTSWCALQPVALLMGVCGAAAFSALMRARARAELLGWWSPNRVRACDSLLAAGALFTPTLGVLQRVWFALGNVRNRELAALLAALASGFVLVAALVAFVLLIGWARTARWRWPSLVLALSSAPYLGWLLHRAGFFRLDVRLWAAPLAAAATILTLTQWRVAQAWIAGTSWRWLALIALATAACAALAFRCEPPATSALERGAWTRIGLALARSATDFDGDGYSAWFGGGDCAPFDPRIHPGAREIPNDGIDNNCFGGDAGHALPPAPNAHAASVPASVPERLNFVLITIETLRGDHVSFAGKSRNPTTPNLLALARESVVFERMYATTPGTRLSLAALLSGTFPSDIRWLPQPPAQQMRRIAPETPWLPELLQQHGYQTYAIHANFRAFTALERAGFDRGFTRYDSSTPLIYAGGTLHGFPSQVQINRAIALLDEPRTQPFFLWLHLLEPHYLYEQSPLVPHFGTDEQSLYDAEIAEADRQVGRLLDALRSHHLLEHTMITVTGDHGEEFGEHGQRWHNSNLYDPQLRTAALLYAPGLPARRVPFAVDFLDFLPTWLDLLHIPPPALPLSGRHLASQLEQKPSSFFVENFAVDTGADWLLGAVDWPLKLIYAVGSQRLELYDLEQDPGERNPLEPGRDAKTRQLADRLFQRLENSPAPGP